jgi:hypothetical protein
MDKSSTLDNSLTAHIFKHQQEEKEIMKNLRFKFPPPKHLAENTEEEEIADKENQLMTRQSEDSSKGVLSSCYRIDSKASIVNGKLILLDTEGRDALTNGRKLMRLLKENNISYKEYMLGDKEKFHQQIAERQKKKEELLIKDYIDKHINMEKTTKIEIIGSN